MSSFLPMGQMMGLHQVWEIEISFLVARATTRFTAEKAAIASMVMRAMTSCMATDR